MHFKELAQTVGGQVRTPEGRPAGEKLSQELWLVSGGRTPTSPRTLGSRFSPITDFPRGRALWDRDSDPRAGLGQEREPTDPSRLSWASLVPSLLLKPCEDGDLSDRWVAEGTLRARATPADPGLRQRARRALTPADPGLWLRAAR